MRTMRFSAPSIFISRLRRAAPLALTLLVFLFAATLETGYVAILDSGIAHGDASRALV